MTRRWHTGGLLLIVTELNDNKENLNGKNRISGAAKSGAATVPEIIDAAPRGKKQLDTLPTARGQAKGGARTIRKSTAPKAAAPTAQKTASRTRQPAKQAKNTVADAKPRNTAAGRGRKTPKSGSQMPVRIAFLGGINEIGKI